MATSNTIVHDLLDENNYEDWRVIVKSYLRSQDLWCVIEYGDATEWLASIDRKVVVNWGKKNAAALHVIQISCSKGFFEEIKETESAKDAWEILAELHPQALETELGSPPKAVLERVISWEQKQTSQKIDCVKLAKSINKGDWDGVKQFADKYPINTTMINDTQTALHEAVQKEQDEIVEELVRMMSEDDLEIQNFRGYTAIALAAFRGKTSMVKCLLEKNKRLLSIGINGGPWIPAIVACNGGHVELTRYLYSRTSFRLFDREYHNRGLIFMRVSIRNNMLNITLDLLRREPWLGVCKEKQGESPILTLSQQSSSFYSGCRISFWQKWIYQCLKVQVQQFVEDEDIVISHQSSYETLIGRIRGIKEIYDLKLRHCNAREVLHLMCKHVSTFNIEERDEYGVRKAAIEAAKRGTPEFFIEMWKANPAIFRTFTENKRDDMAVAVQYRQANVFNRFYGMPDAWKAAIVDGWDRSMNTILHAAGELAPEFQLAQISGAALQMQRELQWFKEVEKIVPTWCKEAKNKDGDTPREVFTKSHAELLQEGQKWMKDTASSYIIAGALIVTIMFAAAFTVPGGNDQNTGFPIFIGELSFRVFLISDSISFFAASTSVLMFLGILTSRYAEDDFLVSLPTKLIIGLSMLFISTTTMMVSFCAALLIMLKGRWWAITIVTVMASIPVTLFMWLQFPLLIRIFISTYCPRIFNKKTKLEL